MISKTLPISNNCRHMKVCIWSQLIFISPMSASATECVKDLDKLILVKFVDVGLVLGSSKFLLLPQLPKKRCLLQKWSKRDSKIIISLRVSKSVTHSIAARSICLVLQAFAYREMTTSFLSCFRKFWLWWRH